MNCLTSACRYCHYYKLEGRRGGHCQMLNVPVHGNWKSCSLGEPAFISSFEELEHSRIGLPKWERKHGERLSA